MIELRMSSNGYGNSQGHYIRYNDGDKVSLLIEQAEKYAKEYDYLTNEIHFKLWRSDKGYQSINKDLIEWSVIAKHYPNMLIKELFEFSYNYDDYPDSVKYPLLTYRSITYLDGCKFISVIAITLRGIY